MEFDPLFLGFPAVSDRGFLGWSSAVLLHGSRPMLYDTVGFNERARLLERLRDRGLAPTDVAVVFLSHFHFDHAANYRLFPNATLVLHGDELAYARSRHAHDLAVPAELLPDLEATGRLHLLEGGSGRFEGVDWFLAPGHTAGLYALQLERRGQTVVLASDAVKNLGELTSGRSAMAHDAAAAARSIADIAQRADLILPGHDRALERVRDGDGSRFRPVGEASVTVQLAAGQPGAPRSWKLAV